MYQKFKFVVKASPETNFLGGQNYFSGFLSLAFVDLLLSLYRVNIKHFFFCDEVYFHKNCVIFLQYR